MLSAQWAGLERGKELDQMMRLKEATESMLPGADGCTSEN